MLAASSRESYLPTEKRLAGVKFSVEAVVRDYFERIGAHELAQTTKAKL